MYLNKLMDEKGFSIYKLSKKSGVPQSTLAYICNQKTHIEKCSAETIYKISKALNVSMESLIEDQITQKTKINTMIEREK